MGPLGHSLLAESRQQHFFSFFNERCFFLHAKHFDVVFDNLIACRHFGNDEVEENDAGHCDDHVPEEPVQHVLKHGQLIHRVKLKVANRDPYYRAEMAQEFAKVPVLHGWVLWLRLLRPSFLVFAKFKIVKVDNGKEHAEHETNDCVENQEGLQIVHDLTNHFNEERHLIEDPQEEECLNEHHEDNYHHKQLSWHAHDIRREALHCYVSETEPDVRLVQPVPRIREVISHTLLVALQKVVNSRINQANTHGRAKHCPLLIVPIHVHEV